MQHKIQPSGYRLPLTCVCTHSDQPCGHCKLKSQQAPKYECSETAIAHATPNGTQSLACPVWQLCLALPLSPLIDPLRCGHSGHCAQACNLPPYFIYFQKPLIEFGPLLLGKALHDVRIFVGIGGIVINWKPSANSSRKRLELICEECSNKRVRQAGRQAASQSVCLPATLSASTPASRPTCLPSQSSAVSLSAPCPSKPCIGSRIFLFSLPFAHYLPANFCCWHTIPLGLQSDFGLLPSLFFVCAQVSSGQFFFLSAGCIS